LDDFARDSIGVVAIATAKSHKHLIKDNFIQQLDARLLAPAPCHPLRQ
jgi:hypothetical protein